MIRKRHANECFWKPRDGTNVSDVETSHSSSWQALEQEGLLGCEWFVRVSRVAGQELRRKDSGLRWHLLAPAYRDCFGGYEELKKE